MQFVDFIAEAKEFGNEYVEAFKKTLDSGWYILGNEVKDFEHEFATYLGAKHVIGVANGLDAIHIALRAVGVEEGDEVITTPLSAMATTLAIMAIGATPVFVDTNDDGLLDENIIESVMTEKTKAILPVHLYGNSVNLGAISKIAKKHNLYLIEDAAQAQGSTYNDQKLGTHGSIGCFSFYPTKNLGAIGDAGAIATNDDDFATKCRQMRDYGQAHKYEHIVYGLNSRLDEVQASILRVKLKYLDRLNIKRQYNAKHYDSKLQSPHVEIIKPQSGITSNYHQYVLKTKVRDKLQKHLQDSQIPSLIHYPILIPDQPLFQKKYANLEIPVARRLAQEVLSIPCGPYLTESELNQVIESINSFNP